MFVIFAYSVSKKLDTISSIINNYFVRQNLIFYSLLYRNPLYMHLQLLVCGMVASYCTGIVL